MDMAFGAISILLLVAMIATALVLFFGVFTMGRRGRLFSPRFSNILMRWRVGLQGVAVLLIGILALMVFLK